MNKNYQILLDEELKRINGTRPSLLLHSCCGPCSSYVVEYLEKYFDIIVFYYNPNIYPEGEYIHRLSVQKQLLTHFEGVKLLEGDYNNGDFLSYIRGYEDEPERGKRCYLCYQQRLEKTARTAKEKGYDYFGTVISVSPYKNADWLYEIGLKLSDKYGVKFLVSDFKKRGGYQRTIVLSKEYGLYRQDYCGCLYSMRERDKLITE